MRWIVFSVGGTIRISFGVLLSEPIPDLSFRKHLFNVENVHNVFLFNFFPPNQNVNVNDYANGLLCVTLSPFSIRSRSNPGTPTQPRRPDFIGVNHTNQMPVSMHTMHPAQAQPMLYSQAMGKPPYDHQVPGIHMNRQMLQQQQQATQPPMMANQQPVYGSPQRRYLSEGELVRQGAELSYARSNNTVDNLRELAGSPQHSMYMWKDNSPGFNGNQPAAQFPGAVAQKQMMRTPGAMPPLPPMQQQAQQQPMQQYVNNPTSPTQPHSSIVANNIQRFNQVRIIHSLVEHSTRV